VIKVVVGKPSVQKPTPKKTFGGLFNKLFTDMGIKPFVKRSQGIADAQRALDETEAHIKRASDSAVRYAMEDLIKLTPKDSGKTAKGWFLNTKQIGDQVTYTISHTDPLMIGRLNSGTKPHIIVPVNGKALRFKIGGVTIFSKRVKHPGTRGTGFVDSVRTRLESRVEALKEL
jgi:hypothetical protein